MVDLARKEVKVEGKVVELLGKEFDLLVYLLQNQNVILPKTQIFDRLWGFDSDTTISVVEVYISKIRKKLKGTRFVNRLQTLRSVGYILKTMNKLKKRFYQITITTFFIFCGFTGIFVIMTIIILQIMRFGVYSSVDSSLVSVSNNASSYANRTMARISSFTLILKITLLRRCLIQIVLSY